MTTTTVRRLEPRAARTELPLSYAQQRIWFVEQLQPGLGLYNEHGALRLIGALDVDRLARSLHEIVARHEILRTVFPIAGDRPVQVVQPTATVPLASVDLRSAPEDARDDTLRRLADEHAHTPFDVVRGPLVRLSIVRLDDDEHVLLVTMHHLVADGWSLWVMTRELAALYDAHGAAHGGPPPLPELPIQYGDFAVWQRASLDESALAAHLAYWRTQLRDAPPFLDLPLDAPRTAVRTFAGAFRSVRLSTALSGRLTELSRRLRTTSFATMLAALHIVLQRWTGQADQVLSVPVVERPDVALEGLVGCFINVLLIRSDLSGKPTASQLIRQVHETVTAAYARQDLPFDRLVRELTPDRQAAQAPFSDVLVNFESFPQRALALSGVTIRKAEYAEPPARFPITIYVEDDGSGLLIRALYQAELFTGARIAALLDQYQHLLGLIADDPEQPIDAYSLVTPRTMPVLPDPAAPLPMPATSAVIDMVREQARAGPDRDAVSWRGRTWSYRELVADADTIASALRSTLAAGDVVAVTGSRGYGTVAALLGGLASRCTVLPLDPKLPVSRQREMLTLARARGIVAAGEVPDALFEPIEGRALARFDVHPFAEGLEALTPDAARAPLALPAPRDPAYIFFTSGTTGTPKAVLGCHGGLAHFLQWQRDTFRIGPSDRCAQLTALSFDVVLRDVFLPLVSGATLAVPAEESEMTGADLMTWLGDRGITVVHVTPSVAQHWLSQGSLAPGSRHLRYAFFAGEPLSDTVVARWRDAVGRECEIVNLYGPTETTLAKCWYRVPADGSSLPPIQPVGWPMPDTQALIVTPEGRLCGVGERGEIVIRTPCRTLGYLNASDEERRRFAVNPHGRDPEDVVYHTGDCGAYRADGAIEIRGRLDDQIKIRGIRIEPQGVSAALARHPRVRSCAVIAEPNARGDMTLLAYVVGDASADELRRFLARGLPAAMVPSHVFLLDRLPLTANGKLDRRALPRPGADEDGPRAEPVLPRTPLEDRLAKIWLRLLALEEVSVADDFFALGGHSLLATELVFQIRRTLGCELSLRQLFDTPTIAGLAAALEGRTSTGDAVPSLPALVPDPQHRHEPFPLTDIQQAYWVGRSSDFALGNVATHNYTEFQFPDLDVDRLSAAFNRLIDRHDMLRAVVMSDGRQQVLPRVAPYAIGVIDLREADADAQSAALRDVRERLAHQVLPLDAWPLFEVVVSRLPGGHAILHVSIDALICDAWSRRLLGRELLQMYRDPASDLPALDLSFRDYVVAETALHDHALYRRAEAYWMNRIAELPPAPELPLACSPESVTQPHFVRQRGRLEAGRWSRLKTRAARSGLTPSGLLCAVYADVLGAWSRTPRFTLNLTLFNRLPLHPRVASLVGDFTSLTLLAIDGRAGHTFEARARAIQAQLWEDLDHRHFSGVRVIRELHRRQGGPRGAIMPVVLTSALFDDSTGESDLLRTWHREHRYGISQTPQVFLDHGVSEQAGALVYTWDAAVDLFPPNVLADMFATYGDMLTALADDDAAWTRRASGAALPEAQRQVRAAANATAAPRPALALHADLVAQIAVRPEAVAVAAPARTLSYAALGTEAAAVTAALRARGVGAELVAVVMEKGWEQVVAVLGIVDAGAAYLPIDASWPQARQWRVLERAQVRLVVTQPAVDARLAWPDGLARLVVRAGTAAAEPLAGTCASPASRAYVIFTSGSTGEPKGVVVDHAAAINTVRDVTARWRVGPADRVLGVSALSFDLSVYDIFGVLGAGGTLVLPAPEASRDPEAWLSLLAEHGVTIWNSVPALFEMLVEAAARREAGAWPPSLRLAMLSGDWIPVTLPGRARALAPALEVVSLGGATEAAIWSIAHSADRISPEWASVPYGRPLTNQTWRVVNALGAQRPDWVAGELQIGGVGLAQGYWRDPSTTADRFVPDPDADGGRVYRTGDSGRYWPDGTIEFLGRTDTQVKVQGHRIELGEIEATLAQHPAVRQAAAVVLGTRHGPKRLLAFVTLDEAVSSEELRRFLQERVPAYMVPPAIVTRAELPLTSNGKVDRRALEAFAIDAPAERPAVDAPPTPVAELVIDACASVLDLDRVPSAGSFFEIGGDSISAIHFASRVREACGVELPLQTILTAASLDEIVESVEQGVRGSRPPDARASRRAPGDEIPLSAAQQRLYLLCRLEPSSPFYNVPDAVRLSGPLRVEILERALAEAVRRHDALRSGVREIRGRPFLHVAAQASLPVVVADATGADGDEVLRLVHEEAARLFDLATPPLCRARLLRIGPDDHVLVLTIHHLIADAWSLDLLYREMAVLYEAFAGGLPSPLSAPSRQASDVAIDEIAWLESDAAARQRGYWTTQLASPLPVWTLPYDTPPDGSRQRAFKGARETFDLSAELTDRIVAVARQETVTPFMLLLAAYALLLSARTGQTDLIISTSLSNGRRPETEGTLGLMLNTVLLRIDLAADPSFRTVLARVKTSALGAHANGDLPFNDVIKAVLSHRSLSAVPISSVAFGMRTGTRPHLSAGLSLTPIDVPHETAKFDLELQVIRRDGAWTGFLDYRSDVFTRATALGLVRQFQDLVAAACAEPTAVLGTLAHRAADGVTLGDPLLRRIPV